MRRHNRLFWSTLVILTLSFGAGLVWHKSASANHNCAGTTGPYGGRRINCTYYANLAIHPGLEVFNVGSWNWPFGYQNEGLVPNNANNNADAFVSYVQEFLFRCGVHPVNENSCPAATPAARRGRWGVTIGHSFIVNTMLGIPGSRFEPSQAPPYNNFMVGGLWYAQDNFDAWATRVRQYDAAGLVTWNQFLTHAQVANIPGNQCGGAGGRSDTVVIDMGGFGMDQGIYNNTFCESANYMVFRHPTTNQPLYRINRKCGNVTGIMSALPPIPAHGFNATPNVQVSVAPGPESPANATFNSGVSYTGAPFQSQLSWRYFVRRYGSGVEQNIGTGSVTRTFTGSSYAQAPVTISLAGQNLQAGDQVCGRSTISPAAGQADPTGTVIPPPTVATRVTPDFCITVVERPYHRAYGGDIQAGLGFPNSAGSCDTSNRARFIGFNRATNPYIGSGAQLAAFALGTIEEFATGQQRASTQPKSLTFANVGAGPADHNPASLFGGGLDGDNVVCAANYYALATGGAPPAGALNTWPNGSYRSGTIQLSAAAALAHGSERTLYVNGDAFITSNITFDTATPYADQTQIPVFRLVVRGNIYVAPGVTRLDGIFVAQPSNPNSGRFYSCGSNTLWGSNTPANVPNNNQIITNCNQRLTVYGAVMAQSLKLLRSNGSLANSTTSENYIVDNNPATPDGNPAELFIFSPEVWLGGELQGNGGEFDYITTLPPVL